MVVQNAHERRNKKPNESSDDKKEHLITHELTCIVINENSAKQTFDEITSLESQVKNNEVSAMQGHKQPY